MAKSRITLSQAVLIPVAQIEANEWNPYEQSPEVFQALLAEIEEDGFDEPIQVVVIPGSGSSKIGRRKDGWLIEQGACRYKIANGEHRWKAVRLAEEPLIPAFIKDWDETTQREKTVRRNQIHGELSRPKLQALAQDLARRRNVAIEALSARLAIPKARWEDLIHERADKAKAALKNSVDQASAKVPQAAKAEMDLAAEVVRLLKRFTVPAILEALHGHLEATGGDLIGFRAELRDRARMLPKPPTA